ncbi:MAG: M23 family metallopeptidase [Vicinamibacteria bacterium]|nr:M23 family metallopeptidase [Vicinamibacteria bacterium]
MRRAPFLLALFMLAAPVRIHWLNEHVAEAAAPLPLSIVRGSIAPNCTLSEILREHLSPKDVHDLVAFAEPVYNLAHVAAGNRFGLALSPEGRLQAFTYHIDELHFLRVIRRAHELTPEILTRRYDVEQTTIAGTIDRTLFAAIDDLGEGDQLALDLADIFAWDVDFNTEIQRGDSFRVRVEKLSLDGSFRRYGRIVAAEFSRGTRVLRAFRFEANGQAGYYAPDGSSLRKAFLRSPLPFARVVSRFSRARLHPILKIVRPHSGVDYAAPVGTPIMVSADGVVSFAGWMNGFGYTIRVRHANGFETVYGHLSSIQVKTGERLAQGAIIGLTGNTGLSSGPHLDYRMLCNGRYVNPLKVDVPPAAPISEASRAEFARVRDEGLRMLASSSARHADASGNSPTGMPVP